MFTKFRNRSADSRLKMSDSALRDIIPSDDVSLTKESRRSPFLRICQVAMCIFILGVIAIAIVFLALILIYSGKSFMTFILQSSGMNLFSASNKTVPRENLTDIVNEQGWKKITVLAASTHPPFHTLLTALRTKQKNKLLPTNAPWMKSDLQSTAVTLQSTIPALIDRTSITTTTESTMPTTDPSTSTLANVITSDPQANTAAKLPPTTSSTRKSTTRVFFAQYKQPEDDDIIDDLLFS